MNRILKKWLHKEVVSWLDAIIAAIIVGMGFNLEEDLEYAIAGSTNIFRVILPAHLLFQAIMGYFYGKARVNKNRIYDVLSLLIPVPVHTFFDMFLIGMKAIVGNDSSALISMSREEILIMHGYQYLIPMLVGALAAAAVVFAAIILMFRQIGVWSKKQGETVRVLKPQS